MTHPTLSFDQQFQGPCVGLDEVGYGPWAGPVVTAAVMILNPKTLQAFEGQVQDSKKLTLKKREALYEQLTAHPDVAFNIGAASVEEIDTLNIRRATCLAMERAYGHVAFQGAVTLLVDGTLPLTHPTARVIPVVKGDAQSFAIACASILAKVTRDRMMVVLHEAFPAYGWDTNVGYGTATHQAGLQAVGVSPHHRRSYAPIRALLERA
jgi:ribonuclease HII